MTHIYGYARVSTEDQDLGAQRDALTAAGAHKIFEEKQSGAKTDREQLAFVISVLQPCDVLLVTRLDRLARSTLDLLTILDRLGKRGVLFKSIAEPWADSTSPYGRLLLTLISGFAEFERHLIKARTTEGHKRAHAEGVKYGRPRRLTTDQRIRLLAMYEASVHNRKIGETFGIHPNSVVRIARQARRELRMG